ncbi:uncharacterized protein CCOS01_12294, partial [Colletotrichum costaricense]
WRLGSLYRFWSILRRLLSATQIRAGIVQPFTLCWFKRLRLHDLARPTSVCLRSRNCSSRQGKLATFREGFCD